MIATCRVGKRGTMVIPARIRRKLGLEEGSLVLLEERSEGLVVRAAAAVPIEIYGPARKAAFLLENAVDEEDYIRARKEVQKMSLDPDRIPHKRP